MDAIVVLDITIYLLEFLFLSVAPLFVVPYVQSKELGITDFSLIVTFEPSIVSESS